MSYGYGGSGWGIGPWGGDGPSVGSSSSTDDLIAVADTVAYDIPLRISVAYAPNSFGVVVRFSNSLNVGYAPLTIPANYSIPGLTVTSAVLLSATEVFLTTTPSQLNQLYVVTVAQAQSVNGDALGSLNSANFYGFIVTPSFLAGAQTDVQVELVFSKVMNTNAAFTNPVNYTISGVEGSIPVLSVALSGGAPIRRATLTLGVPLKSKNFYSVVLSPSIVDLLGDTPKPNTAQFQWADMRPPTGSTVQIRISDFSGEISGGLLGTPAGQVFFSPALESSVASNSTIELEEVSVCTRAFDEYHIPDPPDPNPLYTFSPGAPSSLLGLGTVLWAPFWRLGQAKMSLGSKFSEDVLPPIYDANSGTLESPISDTPAVGTLREPIDITRGSFLNDARWKTFPNPSAIVFATADNATPIGPGPTISVTLSRGPRVDVRDLSDVISFEDRAYPNTTLREIQDAIATSDSCSISLL